MCTVRAVENVRVKYFGDFKKLFLRVMYQSRLCT